MDDKEKLAQMLLRCSLATGHADTMDDLIAETESQIMELRQKISYLLGVLRNIETECEDACPLSYGAIKHVAKFAIAKATGGK